MGNDDRNRLALVGVFAVQVSSSQVMGNRQVRTAYPCYRQFCQFSKRPVVAFVGSLYLRNIEISVCDVGIYIQGFIQKIITAFRVAGMVMP